MDTDQRRAERRFDEFCVNLRAPGVVDRLLTVVDEIGIRAKEATLVPVRNVNVSAVVRGDYAYVRFSYDPVESG